MNALISANHTNGLTSQNEQNVVFTCMYTHRHTNEEVSMPVHVHGNIFSFVSIS